MKKYIPDMDFDIMWEDEVTGHITIENEKIVYQYQDANCDYIKRFIPLLRELDIPLFAELIQDRLWDKERVGLSDILAKIGLSYYDPYAMVRYTHGSTYDDCLWFRFKGEEHLSWFKDIDPRREEVYGKR